jgi:hypothetical protein
MNGRLMRDPVTRRTWAVTSDEETYLRRRMFARPGSNSALRRASKRNPRNLPCPTCKEPNKLTPADVRAGLQCDNCADRDERGW